jgi:hypothetical protein
MKVEFSQDFWYRKNTVVEVNNILHKKNNLENGFAKFFSCFNVKGCVCKGDQFTQ